MSDADARGLVGGRYRLGEPLGRGAIGDVFVAEHAVTGKRFAVKLLNARHRERPEAIERFRREALAAARIEHEHVVDIIDFGHEPGEPPYLVMELLQGESLDHTLTREHRLAWPRVRTIALQIADALAAAHGLGVVHRDLKPANCFRVRSGRGDDFIKIVDFGLAKLRVGEAGSPSLTGTGALLGTLRYMAPEQASDPARVDRRADLYSLGVMIFRMFSGQHPIEADNELNFLFNLLRRPPLTLAAAAPGLSAPPGLAALLERALAKHPGDRFTDAAELAAALRTIADGDDPGASTGPVPADPLAVTLLQSPPDSPEPDSAGTIEALRRGLEARATFYTDARSRWTDESYPLPGGARLVVSAADLCLETTDVLVCTVATTGLAPRTLAARLCEFGGPALTDGLRQQRASQPGQVHTVDPGRLPVRRVVFGVLSAQHLGLQHLREELALLVAGALGVVDRLHARSLAFPLTFSGALGLGRRFGLVALGESVARSLAAAGSETLVEVRVVVDDGGRRLVAAGGGLTLHLPADRGGTQRFVLGRYETMHALGLALHAAIPREHRPPLSGYGTTWSLRDRHSHAPLESLLADVSPLAAGLKHGAALELVGP